jgi:hypothetical protein
MVSAPSAAARTAPATTTATGSTSCYAWALQRADLANDDL